jgi:hypothetical protein
LRQSELIRDFAAGEGVRRLEVPAGALVLEAHGWLREGNYDRALAALTLAEALDPSRAQIAAARARVLWASGAAFGLHIAATFYFRIPFWYGLLFPLGYTAGALMAFDSVRRRLSGRVSWKGRIYS